MASANEEKNLVGEKVCQTVIITYLEVPRDKPPIEKIYSLAGSINNNISFRTMKERIIVQGKIDLETMYKQTDDLEEIIMQQFSHAIDFDYVLAIEGVEKGMGAEVCTEIEYINYSLVDCRTVELEIIFRITAVVRR